MHRQFSLNLGRSSRAAILLLATGGLLAGCGVVGHGIVPKQVQIVVPTNTSQILNGGTFQLTNCVPLTLATEVLFSDGSRGALGQNTDSGKPSHTIAWTATLPGGGNASGTYVDIDPLGGGRVTLTPLQASAQPITITATLVNLTASVKVAVQGLAAGDLKIEKLDEQALTPGSTAGITVAPGSTQDVVLTAEPAGGVPQNLTNGGTTSWALFESDGTTPVPPNGPINGTPGTGVLQINSITSGAVGQSYVLTATVANPNASTASSSCGSLKVSTTVTVANLASLQLAPQPDAADGTLLGYASTSTAPATPLSLIVGNSEALQATGKFASGQIQDLTGQAELVPQGTGIAVAGALVTATAPGTSTVQAQFPAGGAPVASSNVLPLTTVAGTLDTIAVEPASTASVIAGSNLDNVVLHAIGSFDVNGQTVPQDVSRRATWATTSPLISLAPKTSIEPGTVVPASTSTAVGVATVTATVAGVPPGSATVTVKPAP
ncbi:MAG TPA: hypothetical protein VFQ88_12540 [Nevskiaceae bacterium]|nr:hypothetical protein [Nevskiaceae bacterium]